MPDVFDAMDAAPDLPRAVVIEACDQLAELIAGYGPLPFSGQAISPDDADKVAEIVIVKLLTDGWRPTRS